MTSADSYRLLLAARKSRKDNGDATDYERQDHKAREDAERLGHAVVHSTADTVSSQTAPWKRRELKAWMTDPRKMAMYDGILVSDVDRLARATPKDWHYIEHWLYENDKFVWVASHGGFRFPAREGAMGIVDQRLWETFKESARREWEATRDKQAEGRAICRANGSAIGRPPFGYKVTGDKYGKRFVTDPVAGPLALEMFRRIADGRTATSVAEWLSAELGRTVRVKWVLDTIKRRSYLGERDGHTFPLLCEDMAELWNGANEVLAGRMVKHGGRQVVHAYSSKIYCACGATYTHHQSTRNGQNVGAAKYRCSRGRRGVAGEVRCTFPPLLFDWANDEVDAAMRKLTYPDAVMVTTGGSTAKQAELDDIRAKQAAAVASGDMGALTELVAAFNEVSSRETEPVKTSLKLTGKLVCDLWRDGNLAERRELLSGMFHVWVSVEGAHIDYEGDEAEQAA